MGNGGVLPDKLQAKKVILPALNYMFDPGGGLAQTQANFKLLKKSISISAIMPTTLKVLIAASVRSAILVGY
jgi:hypothetical protein